MNGERQIIFKSRTHTVFVNLKDNFPCEESRSQSKMPSSFVLNLSVNYCVAQRDATNTTVGFVVFINTYTHSHSSLVL